MVTRVPDKVTKDKFILLDPSLYIQDEISYFINDISHHSTNYLKSNTLQKQFYMEEYKALSYIFQLSVELAKDSLFYHLGFLFGYRGEELILLLLYSHFNYKLSFYSILMSKYLVASSFPCMPPAI